MQEQFDLGLKAHVLRDEDNRVRAIRHSQEYWESDEGSPLAAAIAYARELAGAYELPSGELDHLQLRATHLDPKPQGVEYRLADERQSFDSTTFWFAQTALNTPVWEAGLKVTVKQGPNRVIRSVNTGHTDVEVEPPSDEAVERYKRLFRTTDILRARLAAGDEPGEDEADEGRAFVMKLADVKPQSKRATAAAKRHTRFIRGRFWVYLYDEEARLPERVPIPERFNRGIEPAPGEVGEIAPDDHEPLVLPLPPVDERIEDGAHYLVAEITFEMPLGDRERLTWRALVEVETNSVLYLRALASDVNGQVFFQDPPTKTGNTGLNSASNNATLNPVRDSVLLQNLDAPSGGIQSLSGTFGRLQEVEGDVVAQPTQPTGSDFLYNTRTNDFAAVSAYFHVDRIFREIASMGWTISGPTGYFSNTNFPVEIDHRCYPGNVMNAHCVGDGVGGIGHVGYGLMDTTDTVNVLGRACDPRVHWHELCGHGILYEAVGSANFGFAHSAGDSLAGIYFDPDSNVRGVDGTPLGKPGDLRFTYVPWHPTLDRRYDRDVAAGWAWGGSQDNGGYGSEEILATTLFRVYRSISGDSADLGRRRFASRMMLYLILRAIENLMTNPGYARDFCEELIATDQLNWTSEGIYGGAYNKVFRWSFERQGEYQVPLITNGGPGDGTITAAGMPPEQDVYIDDGRAGEYRFQPVHWHTTTIWNRRNADGLTTHEEPALGATNYAYVKIKNRGTQTATSVVVRGFHTKPGAGLSWPGDFEAFATPQIAVGTVAGNNTEEKVVGPFQWTPNINAYGHDCMLMVVSAAGDASNVDNFTPGEAIPEWRLVPNDNNIGQRNVQPVAGGGGGEGLLQSLDGVSLWVGNPNPRRALMTLHAELPELLASGGWRLTFDGLDDDRFVLKPGQSREVVIRLQAGEEFTKDAVAAAGVCDVHVAVRADDNLMGGMTYRLDPDLTRPYNARPGLKRDCTRPAKALLDCLGIHDQDVKQVKVKEIIVGFKMPDDGC